MLLLASACTRSPGLVRAPEAPVSDQPQVELAGGPAESAAPAASDSPASLQQDSVVLADAKPAMPDVQLDTTPAAPTAADNAEDASALAGPSSVPLKPLHDPLEPLNRVLFRIDAAAAPAAAAGHKLVGHGSGTLQKGLRNALDNLDEPASFANHLIQGKIKPAVATAARFIVNSTAGLFGLIDVGKRIGLKRRPNDFGQTLAKLGVGPGAYVYLPFTGPTTVRGLFGRFADAHVSPLRLFRLTPVERNATTVASHSLDLTPSQQAWLDRRQRVAGPKADPYLLVRAAFQAPPSEPILIQAKTPQSSPALAAR